MAETPETEEVPDFTAPERGGSAVLHDRFLVDGGKPLPELDSPNAQAFHAEDRRDLTRKLFALVCTPGLPVRANAINAMRGSPGLGFLALVEAEAVFWPILDQRTMIVIYERPLGGRVIDQLRRGNAKLTEYDIPRRVIQPIVEGLREVHTLKISHRAIRPDNIFFMNEERDDIVLGECVTAPPGFDQPVMYEPIERALAMPAGRGEGALADDMYAIGVTFAVLTLGHNPVERVKPEDLNQRRVDHGSYAAICGNARIPLSLLEPLRGLLTDSTSDRWGMQELELWLSGRKQTPQQKKPSKKADNPLRFGGREHTNVRTLAHAFNRNIPEAAKLLRDETFLAWLRRTEDEKLVDALKSIIDNANFHKDDWQGSEEYVVARACIALDPYGPMRYRGFSIVPDGIGPVLALELIRNGTAQIPIEMINRDLHLIWLQNKPPYGDAIDITRNFAQLKHWLTQDQPAIGLERAIYELNPGLPCQSELILGDGVFEVADLLPALDRAANNIDGKTWPMDPHISAFIASRFFEDISPHLRAISSRREDTSLVGVLSLYAFLQWKLRADPLYGLASWIGGLLGPAINSYHNRATRRELEREIPRLVRRGSLPDLFDMIDNAEKRREDQDGYAEALVEYSATAAEIRELEGAGSELAESAQRTGQKTAAMISVMATMIAVSVIFLVRLW
ncbi:MAG: hypothetical protein O2944_01280 [Proteobacteria bacterium]|nr:hypothetical protein [Pseudomonadota bacterium]